MEPRSVRWCSRLASLLLILRGLHREAMTDPVSASGPGWSATLLWIAAAALTYFAFALFKASGDKMPEIKKDTPPAA